VCNVHTHPNLHHCLEKDCPGAIHEDMAKQAGYVDEDGNIKCPVCDCHTYPKGETKVVEIHAKLCTDPTIHYPEWHKEGKITAAQYAEWKSTLSRDELLGRYKRVPDVHVTAQLHQDDAALMDTDLDAFNALVHERIRERAEIALLHQSPHRHATTKHTVSLPKSV
jgi:hypothetical protein